jgi:hypothetical protein
LVTIGALLKGQSNVIALTHSSKDDRDRFGYICIHLRKTEPWLDEPRKARCE